MIGKVCLVAINGGCQMHCQQNSLALFWKRSEEMNDDSDTVIYSQNAPTSAHHRPCIFRPPWNRHGVGGNLWRSLKANMFFLFYCGLEQKLTICKSLCHFATLQRRFQFWVPLLSPNRAFALPHVCWQPFVFVLVKWRWFLYLLNFLF